MNIQIKVRLISKGDDEPLHGENYVVRLYDKDFFNDDFLGESHLNRDGVASFSFSQKDFSKNLELEKKPDFYFLVYKDGQQIFKSKVMSNLDLSNIEEFIMKEGEVVDLGTFLINSSL